MGEYCSQTDCTNQCDLGEVYCDEHIKEYGKELDEI